MLPKFASNFFGHFPRSSSTFRQGFFNSSQAGGSAGGAKYNAGNRFYNYNGYTGSGRAFTQANNLSGTDDERHPQFRRVALASTAVNQSRFATTPSLTRARRNSTSAIPSKQPEAEPITPTPTGASTPLSTASQPAPLSTGTTSNVAETPEARDPSDEWAGSDDLVYQEFRDMPRNLPYDSRVSTVQKYMADGKFTSVPAYNAALAALFVKRPLGYPINQILELYNDMVSKSFAPSKRTYHLVLSALCQRDHEVWDKIEFLKNRIAKRELAGEGFTKGQDHQDDIDRLASLRREKNFASSLIMFKAVIQLGNDPLPIPVYKLLLRTCADNAEVDQAIQVFSHFERFSKGARSFEMYKELIRVYSRAQDINGAQEVFNDFLKVSATGELSSNRELFSWVNDSTRTGPEASQKWDKVEQCSVWTEMINAYFMAGQEKSAVELLERMLNTPNGEHFMVSEPPLPSPATMSVAIKGFSNVDLEAATKWMERLLTQEKLSVADSRLNPTFNPTKPEHQAWKDYIYALAKAGSTQIATLNRIWTTYVGDGTLGHFSPSALDRAMVLTANYNYIRDNAKLPAEEVKSIVDFVTAKVVCATQGGSLPREIVPAPHTDSRYEVTRKYVELLLKVGTVDRDYIMKAFAVATDHVRLHGGTLATYSRGGDSFAKEKHLRRNNDRRINDLVRLLLFGNQRGLVPKPSAPLPLALGLARAIVDKWDYFGGNIKLHYFTDFYREKVKLNQDLAISPADFKSLVKIHQVVSELTSEVKDLDPNHSPPLSSLEILDAVKKSGMDFVEDMRRKADYTLPLVLSLGNELGLDATRKVLLDFDPRFEELMSQDYLQWLRVEKSSNPTLQATPSPSPVVDEPVREQPRSAIISINESHSRYVDEYYPFHRRLTVDDGFKRFTAGLEAGLWPQAQVIGRLINGMGRNGDLEAVRYLYESAQTVLQAMENNKEQQSLAWFQIEDQMIIAYAHADQPELANVHRQRILEMGGVPSADAYAALIKGVKNSTDDTSVALAIWQEARDRGVVPNNYLYNNVISRLAKARKAEQALDLFQEMKSQGIMPTTVTYGAVITACCRVADAASAEMLFAEMQESPRYKPRVPPFNTMLQLFTTSHPSREKVEYYWNLMEKSRVHPSEHTYKLLLDCYGSIEPVNFDKMWQIFSALSRNPHINVTGAHWASVINATGCVGKDLEKTEKIFAGIPTHAASIQSRHPLPDSVCFEAMFNVLLAHHRFDLCDRYLRMMHDSNVQMTAYIANLLIRGYAAAGDIVSARSMFESMSDAPFGVAVPDNHEPQQSVKAYHIPANAPIYREPSTWEAIIRAELTHNNHMEAMNLLARMQQRGFPDAVVARVGAILYPPESIETPETPKTYLSQDAIDTATVSSPTSNQSTHGSSTPPTPLSSVFSQT